MVAVVHDLARVGWNLRAAAVHLHPYLDAVLGAHAAAHVKRRADLRERLLLGHLLRKSVWPNLDAARADILRQLDELRAGLDVLFHYRLIRRLELAHRAQAPLQQPGILQLLL